ncbi:T9SS type A sorting domain-containing protein [Hymenobacter elongatus]|uniref:hypothetical protein n=1 Tax=Hymenobacter elongatus TaxID=877208 RepID=UPI001436AABA|nr:hypothetical protein [Hymenobacter elongatus]
MALTLATSAAHAQTPAWTGAIQPTNPTPTNYTGAEGYGIAVDAGGNQYVTGIMQNDGSSGAPAIRIFGSTSLTSGGGYASGFVGKLSSTQQWLWALKATGNGEEVSFERVAVSPAGDTYASGLVSDDPLLSPNGGKVLTVGTYTYTTTKNEASFITRLNANGQPQWLAGVSGARITSSGWDATAGNLVVAGEYTGAVTFGSTTLPAAVDGFFVARLSAAGQWVSAVGATSTSTASSARFSVNETAVGLQGQVAIAFRIRNTSVTLGSTTVTSTSTTISKCIVAQISAANQVSWTAQTEGTTTTTVPYSVNGLHYDRAGNLWLAAESFGTGMQLGSSTVNEDEFVARLSPTGQWGAVGTIGHSGSTNGASNTDVLAVDAQGNAVILGNLPNAITYTFGTRTLASPTPSRKFVARFNPTVLNWDYAQLAPDVSTNGSYDFRSSALDATGNLFTTGRLAGTVAFGATTLAYPSTSGSNVFVARLSNAGLPLAVRQTAGVAPLAVYPNPTATGTAATLRLPTATLAAQPLVLRDALGRVARQLSIPAGRQEISVPTAGLAPGLYLLEAGLSRTQLVVE